MKIETTVRLHTNPVKERRIIRRLVNIQENEARQHRLEALRSTIEQEVHSKYESVFPEFTPEPKAASSHQYFTKPELVGYEYTPEWWREAEQRERKAEIEQRKQAQISEIQRQADLSTFNPRPPSVSM